mmetsp:Transcript_10846/g.32228  ORF Transcript_10846/g.32228 Transcript_10846/m.32228 type:complete len:309 (-) Transcript_10846:16-942(-)
MPSCGAFCRASASWKHCATKNLLRTAPMSCTVTFLMPTSEQSSDTRLLARTPQPSWRGMTRIFMRWKLWSTRWKTVWPRYSGTYVRLEYESMCALATASCAVAASASPRPRSPWRFPTATIAVYTSCLPRGAMWMVRRTSTSTLSQLNLYSTSRMFCGIGICFSGLSRKLSLASILNSSGSAESRLAASIVMRCWRVSGARSRPSASLLFLGLRKVRRSCAEPSSSSSPSRLTPEELDLGVDKTPPLVDDSSSASSATLEEAAQRTLEPPCAGSAGPPAAGGTACSAADAKLPMDGDAPNLGMAPKHA